MTQEADGLYFGSKHLKQTTLRYSQFIENGQAKLGQHYQILTVKTQLSLTQIYLSIWSSPLKPFILTVSSRDTVQSSMSQVL